MMIETLLIPSARAAVLIAGLFLLRYFLGNRISPAMRHAFWGLVPLALLPMTAIPSPVSVYNLMPRETADSRRQIAAESSSEPRPEGREKNDEPATQSTGFDTDFAILHIDEAIPQRAVGGAQRNLRVDTQVTRSTAPLAALGEPAPLAALCYLAGCLLMVLLFLRQSLRCRRWIAKATPVKCELVLNLYESCRRRMKIKTWLIIAESPVVPGPFLIGTIRPTLLLPAGMVESATETQLQTVFLHELAHLRRWDIGTGWIATLLLILHWFNPMLWLAIRRMNADREEACDALALQTLNRSERQEYAYALVDIAKWYSRKEPGTQRNAVPGQLPGLVGISESGQLLQRRIDMINQNKTWTWRWTVFSIIAVSLIVAATLTDAQESTDSARAEGVSPPVVASPPPSRTFNIAGFLADPVILGGTGYLDIWVENNRPQPVENVVVTSNFDQHLEPTGVLGANAEITDNGRVIFTTIPIILPRASVTLRVMFEVKKSGTAWFRVEAKGTDAHAAHGSTINIIERTLDVEHKEPKTEEILTVPYQLTVPYHLENTLAERIYFMLEPLGLDVAIAWNRHSNVIIFRGKPADVERVVTLVNQLDKPTRAATPTTLVRHESETEPRKVSEFPEPSFFTLAKAEPVETFRMSMASAEAFSLFRLLAQRSPEMEISPNRDKDEFFVTGRQSDIVKMVERVQQELQNPTGLLERTPQPSPLFAPSPQPDPFSTQQTPAREAAKPAERREFYLLPGGMSSFAFARVREFFPKAESISDGTAVRIAFTGSDADHEKVKEIITQAAKEMENEPTLVIYPLLVNVRALAGILGGLNPLHHNVYRTVFTPNFQIRGVESPRSLLVRGRKADHEKLEKILAELQQGTEEGVVLSPGGVMLRSYPLPGVEVIDPLSDLLTGIMLAADVERKKLFAVGSPSAHEQLAKALDMFAKSAQR